MFTILIPEDPAKAAADAELGSDKKDENVDLRTLRAIRVLRPLKLVSGVPSEYNAGAKGILFDPY